MASGREGDDGAGEFRARQVGLDGCMPARRQSGSAASLVQAVLGRRPVGGQRRRGSRASVGTE